MTELEKIQYTKNFIDKLASGINPLDDSPISDGEVAKNPRILGCFSYVSDILGRVIENGGTEKKKKHKKKSFEIPEDKRDDLIASEKLMTISEIADMINGFVDLDETKRLPASAINNWLVEVELLENRVMPNGKHRRLPTKHGKAMGIHVEEREGQYGTYIAVTYDSVAQQFIFDNIEAVIEKREEDRAKRLLERNPRKSSQS